MGPRVEMPMQDWNKQPFPFAVFSSHSNNPALTAGGGLYVSRKWPHIGFGIAEGTVESVSSQIRLWGGRTPVYKSFVDIQ